mgnify:CR=1 FL=1
MSYAPVTPVDFKAMKPQFIGVADVVVQEYLDMAGFIIDDSWVEALYRPAVMAYTCHLMTLDGRGDDGASKVFKSGFSDLQSIRSGSVTMVLGRFRSAAQKQDFSYNEWLAQTACGMTFIQYLRMSQGGPRIAMGASIGAVSGYAKDHPFYGW